jgi:hypothetical protein
VALIKGSPPRCSGAQSQSRQNLGERAASGLTTFVIALQKRYAGYGRAIEGARVPASLKVIGDKVTDLTVYTI